MHINNLCMKWVYAVTAVQLVPCCCFCVAVIVHVLVWLTRLTAVKIALPSAESKRDVSLVGRRWDDIRPDLKLLLMTILERALDEPGLISLVLLTSLYLCVCFTHSSFTNANLLARFLLSAFSSILINEQWGKKDIPYPAIFTAGSFSPLLICFLFLCLLSLCSCFLPRPSLSLLRKQFLVGMHQWQFFRHITSMRALFLVFYWYQC